MTLDIVSQREGVRARARALALATINCNLKCSRTIRENDAPLMPVEMRILCNSRTLFPDALCALTSVVLCRRSKIVGIGFSRYLFRSTRAEDDRMISNAECRRRRRRRFRGIGKHVGNTLGKLRESLQRRFSRD